MLRIHIDEVGDSARFRLEGSLAGAWVEELETCCRRELARPEHRTLVIELDAVSFVDADGKNLLRQMHAAGARLIGRGAQNRYLVEQIQQDRTS